MIFRRIPFHPVLFGIFPPVALLAANLKEIEPATALRSGLVSLALGFLTWLLFRAILRDWRRAAVLASLLAILFYSYGHVYATLELSPIFGMALGRHRLLLPLWIILAAVSGWGVIRRLRVTGGATALFNLISIVLLVLPLARIAFYAARLAAAGGSPADERAGESELPRTDGSRFPDIYYIILDAYARQDVLRDRFGYENGPFLAQLRELGFFVAECSQSNYAQTRLSLASAMDMDYLQTRDDVLVQKLMVDNRALRLLKARGYATVAFETGFSWSQMKDANFYLAPEDRSRGSRVLFGKINAFEVMFVRTTALLAVEDGATFIPKRYLGGLSGPGERHRDRVLFVLNQLSRIPAEIESPKFVFAHLVSPHPPFVFGPHGEAVYTADSVDDRAFRQAYRDQVEYLNTRVLALIGDILAKSEQPPVILLQADHGHNRASGWERMAILNAYYLPEGGAASLYPAVSPVNSFRVVFNAYFGGRFPLLPDNSYYSSYDAPFDFQVIPNPTPVCE